MSSDVVLSAALRSNLLSLQGTQRSIDVTQLRLSTGLKVNSALDNAQSFFTAQALSNRAGDLQRLLDGINQSIRTIEEADNGITALTTLVEQAEAVATEAQSEIRAAEGFARIRGTRDLAALTTPLVAASGGAITAGDDIKIQFRGPGSTTKTSADINIDATDTVYNIVAEINADVTVNQFVRASVDTQGRLSVQSLVDGGFVRILDGTTSPNADGFAFLGLDDLVVTENANAGATRQGGTAVAGRLLTSNASTAAKVNGVFESSATLKDAGFLPTGDDVKLTLEIDGKVSAVYAFDADTQTIDEIVDSINNDATISGSVEASFNDDTGRIELLFGDDVGTAELRFTSVAAGDAPAFGFGTGAADGALTGVGDSRSEAFTFTGASADLDQFQEDFNNIRGQIDDLVEDANYRGVNLLGGDNLTTFFNEDRSNSLVSEGVDFTATGLGIDVANFTNAASVQLSLDAVRSSLEAVRSFGSSIANDLTIIQTRRDFTEQTINTLEAGADDLTVADQNEEGANLLALQTRQQLGVTSLSLASQSQQSILRLF